MPVATSEPDPTFGEFTVTVHWPTALVSHVAAAGPSMLPSLTAMIALSPGPLHDVAMELPAPSATRVQAVIDLMAITTVIDRNGQCRYRVKLTLQNRSEQFLRFVLPE